MLASCASRSITGKPAGTSEFVAQEFGKNLFRSRFDPTRVWNLRPDRQTGR